MQEIQSSLALQARCAKEQYIDVIRCSILSLFFYDDNIANN